MPKPAHYKIPALCQIVTFLLLEHAAQVDARGQPIRCVFEPRQYFPQDFQQPASAATGFHMRFTRLVDRIVSHDDDSADFQEASRNLNQAKQAHRIDEDKSEATKNDFFRAEVNNLRRCFCDAGRQSSSSVAGCGTCSALKVYQIRLSAAQSAVVGGTLYAYQYGNYVVWMRLPTTTTTKTTTKTRTLAPAASSASSGTNRGCVGSDVGLEEVELSPLSSDGDSPCISLDDDDDKDHSPWTTSPTISPPASQQDEVEMEQQQPLMMAVAGAVANPAAKRGRFGEEEDDGLLLQDDDLFLPHDVNDDDVWGEFKI